MAGAITVTYCYVTFKKEKEIDKLKDKNVQLRLELNEAWNQVSLISESYKELKEEQMNIIKPTIYVEKPVIDTLNVMMALPYYNKEDKEEVMEQVQTIMAKRFERDLFDYINWREDYDPVEDITKIVARIRVIKPMERYHED